MCGDGERGTMTPAGFFRTEELQVVLSIRPACAQRQPHHPATLFTRKQVRERDGQSGGVEWTSRVHGLSSLLPPCGLQRQWNGWGGGKEVVCDGHCVHHMVD
ncbi:hypothetical protein JZ751_017131 [Albula glossodonta]|uniref:Uncharacterized protein n=1 Tax=Albula glossodonta TaxID=121402 RepID=A0A8T2NSR6_9TELE|nr:hypothetical protein JZ751_017131 [Albula glossodonta]